MKAALLASEASSAGGAAAHKSGGKWRQGTLMRVVSGARAGNKHRGASHRGFFGSDGSISTAGLGPRGAQVARGIQTKQQQITRDLKNHCGRYVPP